MLLELVDNSSSDTVDQENRNHGRVIGLTCDYGEHVAVKVLVEQLTVLTKSSWQNCFWMSGIRCCIILGSYIDHRVLLTEIDFPNILTSHRFRVDAMTTNLATLFIDCGKEERHVDFVEA